MFRKHFSSLPDPVLSEKTGHNDPLIVNSSDELNCPYCSYSETATNKSKDGQNTKQSVQRKSKSSKSRKRLFPKCTFSSSESDTEKKLDLSDSSEFDKSDGEIIEGDFVVVEVKGQSRFLNYIARVDAIVDLECEGVFLRRIPVRIAESLPTFVIDSMDEASWSGNGIVRKLPMPKFSGSARRPHVQFAFDLENCDVV